MADEPITIRGGSLTIDCDNGNKQLIPDEGNRHRHPSANGTIKSIEYHEGDRLLGVLNVTEASNETQIIIRYEVEAGAEST